MTGPEKQQLRKASSARRPALALLVGLLLAVLTSAVGAGPSAAETRVGVSHSASILLVGPSASIAAGHVGVHTVPGQDVASATCVAAKAAPGAPGAQGGLNLFKHKSPQALRASGWRDGDYFLRNEWKGNVKDTWKANSSLLREQMRSGKPIFDSFVDEAGNLIPTGGFLNMERNVLINRGWTFDTGVGTWAP